MCVPPDFFVGLVTYPRSRFPEAKTGDGLARKIQAALIQGGQAAEFGMVDEDLLTPGAISLNQAAVVASITAELALESRWREYVSGSTASVFMRWVMSMRYVKRRIKLAPPWRSNQSELDDGAKMLRRLANIELAHLEVMRRATQSKAPWVLILEDDACAPNPEQLARQISEFCLAADVAGQPGTMNLSESFTVEQLGISGLLIPQANPNQPDAWSTYSAGRLVTNTVCAVLYRHDFLKNLLELLEAIPLEPVVPIDFKINAAYMAWPHPAAGLCWVCSPAPIVQGSGVPQSLL